MDQLGKRIEALRIGMGLSQTAAAKKLSISQPSLSELESGESKSLKGETLARMCRLFHTTAEYIYFGSAGTEDPEMPLIEAELVYINRALTPDRRKAVLDAARGIFRGGRSAGENDPFPGRTPGDSQPGRLEELKRVRSRPIR